MFIREISDLGMAQLLGSQDSFGAEKIAVCGPKKAQLR